MAKAKTIEEMAENIRKCRGFDTEVLQYEEDGLDNLNVRIYHELGKEEEADTMARIIKVAFVEKGYLDAEVVRLQEGDGYVTVMGTRAAASLPAAV